jgi:aminoglycoside 6'-N-acetyltransferase I
MNVRIVDVSNEYSNDLREMREALYSDLSPEYHDEEMALIRDSVDRDCWVAVSDDGTVLGFVEVALRNFVDGCLTSPVGYIEGIFVKPAFRGEGLGKRLVTTATAWFKDRGCTEMATDSELDNTDAQTFHVRMGFDETYRIVQFKKSIE